MLKTPVKKMLKTMKSKGIFDLTFQIIIFKKRYFKKITFRGITVKRIIFV